MKQFTQSHKLADALHSNYMLIPVVNRFGIRLGFGEKTIGAICAERGIDPDFFIAVINAFGCENYAAAKKLGPSSVVMIVDYLERTHAYYRSNQIPTIEKYIDVLIRSAAKKRSDLSVVKKFFLDYKKELFLHLKREETVTFPYIRSVCEQYLGGRTRKAASPGQGRYSMRVYEKEHDNMDEKLNDLKNILIKYITGEFDEAACNAIVFELFRLEQDLLDHTRMEDHILVPLVMEMEKTLQSRKKG